MFGVAKPQFFCRDMERKSGECKDTLTPLGVGANDMACAFGGVAPQQGEYNSQMERDIEQGK